MEYKKDRHKKRMQRINMLQNICLNTDELQCNANQQHFYNQTSNIHNYLTFNPAISSQLNQQHQQDKHNQYNQYQQPCQQEANRYSLQELVISMLSFDLQLETLVNIFPCQVPELLSKVNPLHHSTLNILISSIPSFKKQIKNEDTYWLEMAAYVFQRSVSYWETRWQIKQYIDIVNAETQRNKQEKIGGCSIGVIEKIVDILTGIGIEIEGVFFKPLVMRILVDQEKQGKNKIW